MFEWLDTSVLQIADGLALTRMWLVVGVASLLLARAAWARRRSPILWFFLACGSFIAASELVRSAIPDADQTFARGQTPSVAYILWSDAAFRADLVIVLVVLGLVWTLARIVRSLVAAVSEEPQATDDRPRPTLARQRLSMWASAAALTIPIVLWFWAGIWLLVEVGYTTILAPLVGFVALATIAGALWARLTGWHRDLALVVLTIAVILAQLRFNATRPASSMFESNGAVPFYIPLIPLFVGLAIGQIVCRHRSSHHVALAGWQFAALAWIMSLIGWFVKFMGFYDYQNSYAFELGSLFEVPFRWLIALIATAYQVLPREIASEDNVAAMNQLESALALAAGIGIWLWVAATLRQRPVRTRFHTLADEVARARGIHLSLQQKRIILAFILITPAIALRTFTTFYPFVQTIILSVQKYNPAFPPRRYIALRNFERLSTDLVVRESLEFTILFVFVSTFFQVFLGLAIAHLLNANFKLRGVARTISLIPWAVPMVVAAIGFRWMFDDQFGMIPDLLRRIGFDEKWLVDPENARLAVTFVNIWKSTPFAALLLLAGLQGISQELYEAAKVDGANWLDSLRFITVPMLLPIIVTISMFLLVWQLAVFDLPFAMTGGGPGFATTVVAQKVYLEINSLNFSYAAAISIALVIVVAFVGSLGIVTLRRVEVSA